MLHSLKAVQNMGRLLLVKFIVAFGRMIIVRRNLSEKDKKEIGTCCCNCGSTEELEYHHIIPICLGGNDTNSNMACLCYPCHQKIHYGKSKHGLHSTVIKMGLEAAKEKGVRLGRPQMTMETLPYNFLKYYPMFQNGNINLSELSRLSGISRPTIYKYLRIIDKQ